MFMAGENVAPLVGAWIEIVKDIDSSCPADVAPLVGAWIEIIEGTTDYIEAFVAPLVGAWIEIVASIKLLRIPDSRSPRGSVD